MSLLGAKETAGKILSGAYCPHFTQSGKTQPSSGAARRHDEFARDVCNRLKQVIPGRCEEDKEIKDKMERAVPDCVLNCGDVYYFVEVKSYPFAELDDKRFCTEGYKRPYLRDLEQALEYARRWGGQGKKRVILVYRGLPFEGMREKPIVFEVDVDQELSSELAYGPYDFRHARFKPGPECLACEQKECPIKDAVRKYLQNDECHNAGAPSNKCSSRLQLPRDEVEAYQRLLLTEWCLARHSTRCVKCGPMHFALSQNTYHRNDLPLTEYHVKYAVQDNSILNSLVDNGVLIERECTPYTDVVKKLTEAQSHGELIWVSNIRRSDYILLLEYLSLLYNTKEKRLMAPKRCYRTFHGMVAQLLRNTAALPGYSRTFEGFYLPAIVDYLGEDVTLDNNLRPKVVGYVEEFVKKLGVNVDSKLIEKALESLSDEKGQRIGKLRSFQLRALETLSQNLSNNAPSLILLTAPPGAGKTLVFLMMALAVALGGGKVLIMYPTKKLAVQQVQQLYYTLERLNEFLKNKKLRLAIADGDSRECPKGSARALKCNGGRGTLHYDGAKYICKGKDIAVDWFCECEKCDPLSSHIIVTNPFKLSSILMNKDLDKIEEFARDIKLIVVDEAHTLIETKRLDFMTALLHRLILLGGLENKLPTILLSSATITSSGLPLAEGYGEGVSLRSVGILERVEKSPKPETLLNTLAEQLLGGKLAQKYNLVAVDYYEAPERSGRMKITAPMIVFTSPDENPSGTVQEAVVTLSLASGSRTARCRSSNCIMRSFSSIIFFDNKEELHEVERYVRRRLLAIEGSPADKTLSKPLVFQELRRRVNTTRSPKTLADIVSNNKWGELGRIVIHAFIHKSPSGTRSQCEMIDEILREYNHLPLFCSSCKEASKALEDARSIYEGRSPISKLACFIEAANVATDIIYDTLLYEQEIAKRKYILMHHADLKRDIRYSVEGKLENPGEWAVVLATSTLEVGVNLRGVGVVAQYGLPPLVASVIQRFGRGGRDEVTLYSSLGVLFPRHTGEDIALLDEDYAVSRMFAFRGPVLPPRDEDRILAIGQLIAYTTMRHFDYKSVLSKSVELLVKEDIQDMLKEKILNRAEQILRFKEMLKKHQITPSSREKLIFQAISEILKKRDELQELLEKDLKYIVDKIYAQNLQDNNVYKSIINIYDKAKFLLNLIRDNKDILYNRVAIIYTTKEIQDQSQATITELSNNYLSRSLSQDLILLTSRVIKDLKKIATEISGEAVSTIVLAHKGGDQRELEVRALRSLLVPPLMHPYIIDVQSDLINVTTNGDIHRKGIALEEVFENTRPLKVDRYSEIK